MLDLQRTAGNRATTAVAMGPPTVQRWGTPGSAPLVIKTDAQLRDEGLAALTTAGGAEKVAHFKTTINLANFSVLLSKGPLGSVVQLVSGCGFNGSTALQVLAKEPTLARAVAMVQHQGGGTAVLSAFAGGSTVWAGETGTAPEYQPSGATLAGIQSNSAPSYDGAPPAGGKTYAGNRPFGNHIGAGFMVLPKVKANGDAITYTEYDIKPFVPGDRGPERVVVGSDGSKYFTSDHYATFKKFT